MAEKMGFEPTIPSRVYSLSRGAPSTTRPPLRWEPDRVIRQVTQALFRLFHLMPGPSASAQQLLKIGRRVGDDRPVGIDAGFQHLLAADIGLGIIDRIDGNE